jgi:molecular chaperone GrpE (heat shock protein)
MSDLLKRLFGRSKPALLNDESLALQSEAQRLRLALEEAQSRIAALEAELARQQRLADASREAALQARLLVVFTDLAGPAAQFLLQLDLAEIPDRTPQARDTLAVARSILRTLQNHGLEISEPAGAAIFDPTLHEPLSSMDALQPGQPVRVRVPGLSYRGQRLRKAGVVPQDN